MRQREDKEDEVKEKHPPQLLGGRGNEGNTRTKTEPHLLISNMWQTAARRGREKEAQRQGGLRRLSKGCEKYREKKIFKIKRLFLT